MAQSLQSTVRTLVLGVGNPILSDDGVGIHAARLLKEEGLTDVDVEELPAGGLELLDLVRGYDLVVIIDAIQTRDGKPGDIYRLEEKDFERTVHGSSPHGINIATALALGRKIVPEQMPREVHFIAVEAKELVEVSESMTAEVERALPEVVRQVRGIVRPSRS